jgi:hypothetical protein
MGQSERILPKLGSIKTPHDGGKIVYWEDIPSAQRIARAINGNFLRLIRNFEPQADKFMCGPASLAIVMNALKANKTGESPLDRESELYVRRFQPNLPEDYNASFPRYTQKNIFDIKNTPKDLAAVYGSDGAEYGMNLVEMHEMLQAHGFRSQMYKVTGNDSDFHQSNISHTINTPNAHIIANFDRKVWGYEGNGHVCPVGAYDVVTNSILLLDVNPVGRWLWIDFGLLMQSMTVGLSPVSRGYLIVT